MTNRHFPILLPLFVFFCMSVSIGAAGFVIFDQNKRSITQTEIRELNEVADFKAARFSEWHQRQLKRADAFAQNSLLIDAYERWLQQGKSADTGKLKILDLLTGVQEEHGYQNVSLLDRHGAVRISTGDEALDAQETNLALESMENRQVRFTDTQNKRGGRKIDFFVPLVGTANRVIGAVHWTIDPKTFLHLLLDRWPLSSKTAETLLASKVGNDLVLLSDLRHRTDRAIARLAAQDWLGSEFGVSEGIDYRGIKVFSATRPISGTPWLTIAKIDKDELLAPVMELQRLAVALGLVFMASMVVLAVLWHRGSKAQFMQAKIELAAAAELETMTAHFDYMTKFANDIVVLSDDQGNILESNDRASLAYGYSRDELRGMPLSNLVIPEHDVHATMQKIDIKGGLKFETLNVRSDKSTFPAECSVRAIVIDGKKFFQGIIRDITERKQAEEKAFQMNHFILQVIDTDPNRIFVKNGEGRFLLVNKAMADSYGLHPREMVGKTNAEVNQNRLEVERYAREDREVIRTRQKMVMIRSSARSGEPRWHMVIKVPMEQADGNVNVLGIAVNITDSKITEERLAESYRELEKITTHMEVIREEEQKRIARELHDEMGAILTAQNINVSLLSEKVRADFPQLESEVEYLQTLVTDGIAAMRQTVSRLRPSLLDEVGLAFAIERYVQQFAENTGITCNLRLPEEESAVDEKKSTAIFRIIQESLTNVAKHAEASKVDITLSEWDDSLVLTVQDNGRGFNLENRKINTFGLLGIKERAAMVGGKGIIDSSEGKGVKIRVSMPR